MPHSLAQGGAGHVHGGVAGANDDHPLAQMVAVGVVEVVDAEMHMAQSLAFDVQSVGLPDAGADEDGLVAVPEQIVDADGPADGGVGPHLDVLQTQVAVFKIVQNAFGPQGVPGDHL